MLTGMLLRMARQIGADTSGPVFPYLRHVNNVESEFLRVICKHRETQRKSNLHKSSGDFVESGFGCLVW